MRITENVVKVVDEIKRNPNQTMSDIVRRTGVSKQNTSQIIKKLIKNGSLTYEKRYIGKFTLKLVIDKSKEK